MTGNMKAFLKKLSGNNELAEKAAKLDKESLIALAKELGFELTEADFAQPEGEISENEMDAVVGGYKQCVCAYGGGGAEDDQGNKCVCGMGHRQVKGNQQVSLRLFRSRPRRRRSVGIGMTL